MLSSTVMIPRFQLKDRVWYRGKSKGATFVAVWDAIRQLFCFFDNNSNQIRTLKYWDDGLGDIFIPFEEILFEHTS